MAETISCAHCSKTGTCENGTGGMACQLCVARWSKRNATFDFKADLKGIPCSTCWGKGFIYKSLSEQSRFDNTVPAVLGGVLAGLSFALLFYLSHTGNGEGFNKALVFTGTLLGSITGYYFGAPKRARNKQSDDEES
jgi:hypothetical protein